VICEAGVLATAGDAPWRLPRHPGGGRWQTPHRARRRRPGLGCAPGAAWR